MSADSKGIDVIEKIISAFEVDTVLVLDYERLHNELFAKYNGTIHIVKLDKSGGASDSISTAETKQKQIKNNIMNYFRGNNGTMKAYQISIPLIKFRLLKIYSILTLYNIKN